MAYTDFTVLELRRQFGVGLRAEKLFAESVSIEPTEWLRQSIRMGLTVGIINERARAERLATPVLLELCTRTNCAFSVHSAAIPDAAQVSGGNNSFTCSLNRLQDFITPPVFLVMNISYRETEEELLPLLQQLIAARRLNELAGCPTQPLYGCSTTGVEWRFLKYEGTEFILDENRYYLAQLPALLGALQAIVDATRVVAAASQG